MAYRVLIVDDSRAMRAFMLELGARGYVTKPVRPEILLAQLERCLGAFHE